jgi:hypothetical protein
VQMADIILAGDEQASSQAIQIINDPAFATIPTGPNGCVAGGTNLMDPMTLGANGILGVGQFAQDCGVSCQNAAVPGHYYGCPAMVCSPTTLATGAQLQNPVGVFPQDNNGVMITLPPAPDPMTGGTVNGTLTFGIGTRTNNQLGSAQIYATDPTTGSFTATYMGTVYPAFVDSRSPGLFFLDPNTTGLPVCTTTDTQFYCPMSTTPFTVTNTGTNLTTGQLTFSVANAQSLLANFPTAFAFSNLGGPFPMQFRYGLPFFFGTSVFVGIESKSTGAVTGPFVAF